MFGRIGYLGSESARYKRTLGSRLLRGKQSLSLSVNAVDAKVCIYNCKSADNDVTVQINPHKALSPQKLRGCECQLVAPAFNQKRLARLFVVFATALLGRSASLGHCVYA